MAKITYCVGCKTVSEHGDKTCPVCCMTMIETTYSDIYWSKCSEDKRNEILEMLGQTTPDSEGQTVYDVAAIERQQMAIEERKYQAVMMTTGPSFEGYRIIEYKDIVCGEIVVPNGILGALTSGTFFTISALDKARTTAMINVKKLAYERGANAIIAVDIDVSDLNGNGVMVSVNGTAVIIEKI